MEVTQPRQIEGKSAAKLAYEQTPLRGFGFKRKSPSEANRATSGEGKGCALNSLKLLATTKARLTATNANAFIKLHTKIPKDSKQLLIGFISLPTVITFVASESVKKT